MVAVITIPKELSRKGELVLITRKEYDGLLRFYSPNKKERISERDILRWVKEATVLKKADKLPVLKSLSDLEK